MDRVADILIIDDDAAVREVLRRILESDGHTVREAEDGEKGLRAYRVERADLVIADILMPVMNGLELIQEIRRESPAARIIAITGYDSNEEAGYLRLAEEYGAARTFNKPVMVPELLSAVAELVT